MAFDLSKLHFNNDWTPDFGPIANSGERIADNIRNLKCLYREKEGFKTLYVFSVLGIENTMFSVMNYGPDALDRSGLLGFTGEEIAVYPDTSYEDLRKIWNDSKAEKGYGSLGGGCYYQKTNMEKHLGVTLMRAIKELNLQ